MKSTSPCHNWVRGEPCRQKLFSYVEERKKWLPTVPQQTLAVATSTPLTKISILSWNVDFMAPLTQQRMTAALKHLASRVDQIFIPCCIMLQEMLKSDLDLIQAQPWIQKAFHLTDISEEYWESGYYGTVMLVSKTLHVDAVFRVHYEKTRMERDGLFVDITFAPRKILRLCNTHLESLVANPPIRPAQLASAARYMHDPKIHGSILGGDLNAIQTFDETLHSENDLTDAYLKCGGEEGANQGMTWGQMATTKLREQFGLSRMDKLLFCGGLNVQHFGTFGFGIEVEDEQDRQRLIDHGFDAGYVTDHLGIQAVFEIVM